MSRDLPPGDEGYEAISQRIESPIHDGRLAPQGDTKNWLSSQNPSHLTNLPVGSRDRKSGVPSARS
jgi:hypothetical protein